MSGRPVSWEDRRSGEGVGRSRVPKTKSERPAKAGVRSKARVSKSKSEDVSKAPRSKRGDVGKSHPGTESESKEERSLEDLGPRGGLKRKLEVPLAKVLLERRQTLPSLLSKDSSSFRKAHRFLKTRMLKHRSLRSVKYVMFPAFVIVTDALQFTLNPWTFDLPMPDEWTGVLKPVAGVAFFGFGYVGNEPPGYAISLYTFFALSLLSALVSFVPAQKMIYATSAPLRTNAPPLLICHPSARSAPACSSSTHPPLRTRHPSTMHSPVIYLP